MKSLAEPVVTEDARHLGRFGPVCGQLVDEARST